MAPGPNGATSCEPRSPRGPERRPRSDAPFEETMPTALDAIVADLKGSDRQERIDLLLDFAKSLPPLPERLVAHKDASHRVEECQSPVYLFVELDDGPRLSVRRRADRGPDGPRVCLALARGLERRDGRGDSPGARRPGRSVRAGRDPGNAPGARPLGRAPAAQGRGDPGCHREGRLGYRAEKRIHPGMPSFVKVATRRELATGRQETRRGRRPADRRLQRRRHRFTPSTTSAPTTAVRWPRASSSGCEIMCPRHGARFDVRTGKALCMPAIEPVAVHATEVRGDDVYVALSDD